jgi:hypothetical protein
VNAAYHPGKVGENYDTLNEDDFIRLLERPEQFHEYELQLRHMMSGDALDIEEGKNYFSDVTSPLYEIYRMLAPSAHIMKSRTGVLSRKFKDKEGWSDDTWNAFDIARKQAAAKHEKTNTYTLEKKTGYAMVLGFADAGGVEEKFIPNPEMVTDAFAPLDNRDIKQYFLSNLPYESSVLDTMRATLGDISRDEAVAVLLDGERQGKTVDAKFTL